MFAQRHARVADIYQNDLERHLFAMETNRRGGQLRLSEAVRRLYGRWESGWVRCKVALANAAYFL